MRSTITLTAVLLTLLATMLTFYFGFTPDDAYIYMRYGANLSERGELVFNPGEWVSTMTSPAMALVYAALHALGGEPRIPYKLLSVGLLLFTGVMVGRSARRDPLLRVAVLAIALLSPCVVMWTVGGMATPMLMALVTGLTALTTRPARIVRAECVAICGLCGLCFLVRYDSALYAAPVAIYALRGQSGAVRAAALLVGAAVPVAWLGVALRWYGDIFPTSFYVKTPSASPANLAGNAFYIAQHLVFTGIVPLGVFLFAGTPAHRFAAAARRFWGPYVGIGLMLAYGLTSATTHMMFGFRYFCRTCRAPPC